MSQRRRATMNELEGELVVRPEEADDEVLGAGRLVVDDDLADRGDERGRAGQEAGQQLRDAERRERSATMPGDGGRSPSRHAAPDPVVGAAGEVACVVLTSASSPFDVTFACRGVSGSVDGRAASGPRRARRGARPSIGSPKAQAEDVVGHDLGQRPGGDRAAVGQHERVGEPGRDLLDVMGDEHDRRRACLGGKSARSPMSDLARPEVEAGGGLVEQEQVRIGHQRPRDRGPPALARRTGSRTGGRRPPRPRPTSRSIARARSSSV